MTAPRNLDRLIRTYLNEDPVTAQPEVPDYMYVAIRDGIDRTRQRAVLGSRGVPDMNNIVRVGLGAAAVVVIAIVAINLLPGSPPPGGKPSVSPSVEPSVEPSAEPSTAGDLPEGSHILSDGQLDEGRETVPMTVTIPAPGWYGDVGGGILEKGTNGADAPDGAGMIVYPGALGLYVYGDPCQWSTTRPDSDATTVEDVVAALAAQASRDASAPVDIALDGYSGKAITLHVPDDADFSECDQGSFRSWGVSVSDPSRVFRQHQGPGQIDEVWILDVDGLLVVIDWAYFEATPQADVDELRAIVESTTFE